MSQTADQAYIARQRWRADLHRLNGDHAGAEQKEREAACLERYHEARDNAHTAKASMSEAEYGDSAEKLIYDARREELQALRRSIRSAAVAQTIINDFEEPSDDQLLAGGN